MSGADNDLPLGNKTEFVTTYTPSLLRSISRAAYREGLGAPDPAPFVGEDVWTCYELSWLLPNGRPQVAVVRIQVPSVSPAIVESKSLKLYLNSFTQTVFQNRTDVLTTLDSDLGVAFRSPVIVSLLDPDAMTAVGTRFPGQTLDEIDVAIDRYEPDPGLLENSTARVVARESVYTHAFRTVCPVTGQPDWASVWIDYLGPRIDRGKLIAYLVSYRLHPGFHEAAIERIFLDLLGQCGCERLSVHGRFLRRGGIDINPFRSTHESNAPSLRASRQ